MGKFKDGFNVAVKNGIGMVFHPRDAEKYINKMREEGEEIEKKYEKDKRDQD